MSVFYGNYTKLNQHFANFSLNLYVTNYNLQ